MTPQSILQERKDHLLSVIRASFGKNLQSDAFAVRVLGMPTISQLVGGTEFNFFPSTPDEIIYHGVPRIACVGFGIGVEQSVSDDIINSFIAGLGRLQHRSDNNQKILGIDDLALLGLAAGIAQLKGKDSNRMDQIRSWLLQIIEGTVFPNHWSNRMRSLAGDLLDNRGRLRVQLDTGDTDALALELALRSSWPISFRATPNFSQDTLHAVLQSLLKQSPPPKGDLEKAVVWLKALDVIVDLASHSLLPSISDTARILSHIQHALKRWRWEEKAQRRATKPSQWLIDNEYDVQSLLWTILYPIYGADLVDETYLPNWGNVQPRADLGISKLKLIIEVKIAREPGDFRDFEGQIGEDIGLYFKDTTLFDRMIAFIYDDCDKHEPERYDSLKNALKKRERIEEVIIVRRPSMIPDRHNRGPI